MINRTGGRVAGWSAVVAVLAGSVVMGAGKLPPPANRAGVTYAQDIKPIFEKSCLKCHGPEKQKGKLRLDSLEAVLKGGGHGKVVVAGKSAESRLVLSVAGLAEKADENMPPEGKGDPLTKEQIALIRAWIDQGAK